MRVFVTGASGWIGTAVVKELIRTGHQVLGLARSESGAAIVKGLGAEVLHGTLHDLETLKKGAAECDGVIHLAFMFDFADFEGICRVDREAIAAMASVMEGTNKPLIITSGTLMLAPGTTGTEDDLHDSTSFAGSARGQSETLARSLAAKGIRTVIMRLAPTNHGEGDHGFITMMMAAARDKEVAVYFDPESRWPATHRLDTARAYVLALEKAPAGSTLHPVAEEAVKMKDIVTAVGKQLNVPVESRPASEAQDFYGLVGFAMATDNTVSSKKTRELLGWAPQERSLIGDIEGGAYAVLKPKQPDRKE